MPINKGDGGEALMEKGIRDVYSAIEDLTLMNRSSRESDLVGSEDCLSMGLSDEGSDAHTILQVPDL